MSVATEWNILARPLTNQVFFVAIIVRAVFEEEDSLTRQTLMFNFLQSSPPSEAILQSAVIGLRRRFPSSGVLYITPTHQEAYYADSHAILHHVTMYISPLVVYEGRLVSTNATKVCDHPHLSHLSNILRMCLEQHGHSMGRDVSYVPP